MPGSPERADGPRTVVEALCALADVRDRGYVFLRSDLQESTRSFADVVGLAGVRGRALRDAGLRRGDRVGLVLPDHEDFVPTFLGAILAGLVPVPMSPPPTIASNAAFLHATAAIVRASGARAVVTGTGAAASLHDALEVGNAPVPVIGVDALTGSADNGTGMDDARTDDVCYLQFTSGSTGSPKGVHTSHANVAANVAAIRRRIGYQPGTDRIVTWLPLHHDMGLVGHVLVSVFVGLPVVFLPTLAFAKRPSLWMATVHRYRGTITFAPNFAFALATRRTTPRDVAALDLTCLRVVGCGAEPIHASTLRRFATTFEPAGLDPRALVPSYGMAEATLAISLGHPGTGLRTERIDRGRYEDAGVAEPPVDGRESREVVSCGTAVDGHEVLVTGADGAPLPERHVGEIVARGPSVVCGYVGGGDATDAASGDGWLRTGDLGFLMDGELFVCGRKKDLIIINGRNYHPQDIESVVEDVPGVRLGKAAAFAVEEPDGEKLVVMVERHGEAPDLARAIAARVRIAVGVPVHRVAFVATLARTSSGKIRRQAAKHLYQTAGG